MPLLCPFCKQVTDIVDAWPLKDHNGEKNAICRRRQCASCKASFETIERPVLVPSETPYGVIQRIRADHERGLSRKQLLRKYGIQSINTLDDWLYGRSRVDK